MANETLFRRYEKNPIIVPEQDPRANSIFNSAPIRYADGYVGVFRVDEIDRRATLHVGRSEDGLRWDIEPERLKMQCSDPEIATHAYGYDPRVTPVEGVNYLTWCNSYHGPTIGLARTDELETFAQMEDCFPPYDRNGVLFPRKLLGILAGLLSQGLEGNWG